MSAPPDDPALEPTLEPVVDPAANPQLWWSTYNAAITGLSANETLTHLGVAIAHERAVRIANMAHGPIVLLANPLPPDSL